jgi:hypothetical protein
MAVTAARRRRGQPHRTPPIHADGAILKVVTTGKPFDLIVTCRHVGTHAGQVSPGPLENYDI